MEFHNYAPSVSAAIERTLVERRGESRPQNASSTATRLAVEPFTITNGRNLDFSRTFQKKLLLKIDMRVMPIMTMLFFVSCLSRTSITFARNFGIGKDINIDELRFNGAVMIFFLPTVVIAPFANNFLLMFKPKRLFSAAAFCLGFMTMIQGVLRNYGSLLLLRFLMGAFDTFIVPGILYSISLWYTRKQAGRRCMFFMTTGYFAASFSSIIAYGASQIETEKMSPWRWIFIIEGVTTILVAALAFVYSPDLPADATWLSPDERHFQLDCVKDSFGRIDDEDEIGCSPLLKTISEPKILCGCILYLAVGVPWFGTNFLADSIARLLPHSPRSQALLEIPPFAMAWMFSAVSALISDRIGVRYPVIAVGAAACLCGFILLRLVPANGTSGQLGANYAGLIISTVGIGIAVPIIQAWIIMNIRGSFKRGVAIGYLQSFWSMAGLIAAYVFLAADEPLFNTGKSVSTALLGACLVASSIYVLLCDKDNVKLNRAMTSARDRTSDAANETFRYMY